MSESPIINPGNCGRRRGRRRLPAVVASLGVALALCSPTDPAHADPTPAPTTTPAKAAPAAPMPATEDAPAELREAVERDLGLDWEDYVAHGAQAERAAVLADQLTDVPGYQGVFVDGGAVVVTGTGGAVNRAARQAGVRTEPPESQRPLDAEQIKRLYAAEVDGELAGLAGLGWTGTGWLITVSDPDATGWLSDGRPGRTPNELAADHPELTVRAGEPATSHADILGGQGWGAGTRMPRCSIGFAGFGPDGQQAMLTAGHCSDGGTLSDARWEDNTAYSLGRLAFTQFGTVDNSANTVNDPGADVSAYAGAHTDLRGGLAGYPGAMPVTGSTAPIAGAPICMSGRTSRAWQCATIEAVGPFAVTGPGGPQDIRW
ncbi:MAG: hypothetical protein Q4F67_10435, partial [Propionibacteriaceae bacterium]|nr:hypothetical protein [Propionibacteriaceae bacterium]